MDDHDSKSPLSDASHSPSPAREVGGSRRHNLRNELLAQLHKDEEKRRQILWYVIELFLAGYQMTEIRSVVRRELGINLTTQAPYRYLRFAALDGQLLHAPPRNARLARCLEDCPNTGEVFVSNATGTNSSMHLATQGAKTVLRLIQQVAAKRPGPVHVGIGIGYMTGLVIDALSRLYRGALDAPPLVIHALATSWAFWDHGENPHTFYGYLRARSRVRPELIGLPGLPAVKASAYAALKNEKFLKGSFARRDEVDVVVTSLACAADERGYLYQYLTGYDREGAVDRLRERGWVGDVQLRPYSDKGPIAFPPDVMKPVTLFELKDLVAIAREPDRHVVLLCSSGLEGKVDKAAALEPLLKRPKLHVWDHLLLDLATAEAVVARNPEWKAGSGA